MRSPVHRPQTGLIAGISRAAFDHGATPLYRETGHHPMTPSVAAAQAMPSQQAGIENGPRLASREGIEVTHNEAA